MEKVFAFLEEIKQKEAEVSLERLLDFVYEWFDENLRKQNFSVVDNILLVTQPESLTQDVLLTFLTVTWPASHELKNWTDFFSRAKKCFPEDFFADSLFEK